MAPLAALMGIKIKELAPAHGILEFRAGNHCANPKISDNHCRLNRSRIFYQAGYEVMYGFPIYLVLINSMANNTASSNVFQ